MMIPKLFVLILSLFLSIVPYSEAASIGGGDKENTEVSEIFQQEENGASFYKQRPDDAKAVYFTSENFNISSNGKADVSDALQKAIKQVKEDHNFGIVFIPEGTYLISKTIYIPKAVRLIGYGKNRPLIVLGKDSPGFQKADPEDKGQAKYMFWFTDRVPEAGEEVKDANAGTFYSALSNINLEIKDGNPAAVALRTHFAQHSFISHADINIGKGKAGLFDVGNEIENVRFFGGEYGIYTTKPSPGGPFLMIDTSFEGQRKAAIKTQEAGLTIIRMRVKNVPTVVEINPAYYEKLYMEDCRFENVSGPALIISNENNAHTQINFRNIACKNVPLLVSFIQSGKKIKGKGKLYKVKTFTHGNQIDELGASPKLKTTKELVTLSAFPDPVKSDLPALPAINSWVNLKSMGAKGDGETDDTKVLQEAIKKYATIYIPQGWYKISETIKLKPNTVLIGLNPIATQLKILDNTESFRGFGAPKPLLEAPQGGANIVTGIGLDAGGSNPRAVACKWMAGANSYMNDVKFVGGHGSMNRDGSRVHYYNENRTGDANLDRKWDSQYWSLWVTNGGGGIFKDIWTASPYAAAGLYVSNTSTVGKIYAMSGEHHVRNEIKFKNVSNWKIYALQLEEEIAESWNALPLEVENSNNLLFANTYLFRTIWLENPYPYANKTWDSEDIEFLNVHNFTQVKYTIDNTLYDVGTQTEVRPWQIARLYITGKAAKKESKTPPVVTAGELEKIAGGFEFADAITTDSKGNIYFSDSRWKRIYKWSVENERLSLVTDMPLEPLSLACDTGDNLLVVVEYTPPKGATINGKPETYPKPEDAKGTAYGVWYNTGSTTKVYAIDPETPEESMQVLEPVSMESVEKVHKALYPANRWRDNSDYMSITVRKPEQCYVAPDGVTIIPLSYDLIRANSLLPAYPGKLFYAADEYDKRTVSFNVSPEGYLSDAKIFAEKGEYNIATDSNGNVYVPDGQIYVYNPSGELIDEIKIPERPATIAFGGKDGNTLFITARSSVYSIQTKPAGKQQ
jgi:sugar lactone lactonase YvrE